MKIEAINISEIKGTIKKPIESARLEPGGVVGDSHFGSELMQVSFLAIESIEEFGKSVGRTFPPGTFAENITFSQLPQQGVHILDRLKIGESLLEVIQLGKKCHNSKCEIFMTAGKCIMPWEGFFCRVLNGGEIKPGDTIEYLPRTLKLRIITLSSRASKKIYEDKSGPLVKRIIGDYLTAKNWKVEADIELIDDSPLLLREKIDQALKEGVRVIITNGGTGLSHTDIAPDVVTSLCTRNIPGIMEYIRVKYGDKNPHALLSRSVAGMIGDTLVYTFPGSQKAVEEYSHEILRTLEHIVFITRGLMVH